MTKLPRPVRDIRTIPLNVPVRVLTVRGIICRAITYPIGSTTRWVLRPTKNRHYTAVACYRLKADNGIVGEVRAIAWGALSS